MEAEAVINVTEKWARVYAAAVCVALAAVAAAADGFVTDARSPELKALARPLEIDESKYGCGPLLKPGRTYYLSLRGDDKADGLSWATAWRRIHRGVRKLRPGDTLIIGEGEYVEPNFRMLCRGEPGKPITIMAAPRRRVALTSAVRLDAFTKTAGARYTFEANTRSIPAIATRARALTRDPDNRKAGPRAYLWESDTLIMLQNEGTFSRVDELPGSYCFDSETGKLYVHFSDSRGAKTHHALLGGGGATYYGVQILGSYIRLKGLHFKHYIDAVAVRGSVVRQKDGKRGPYPRTYRGGHHVTVEDCAFYMNVGRALRLTMGARWTLVKGNYGAHHGVIMLRGSDMADNLIIGNHLDPSPPSMRTRGKPPRATGNYGWPGEHVRRYYLVNNIINSPRSFLSKAMGREIVIEGNVMVGLDLQQVPADLERRERLVLRNNVLLGRLSLGRQGPGGFGGAWAGGHTASVNNFCVSGNRDEAVRAARFADPTYLDYRLQSDSPLKGKALGGGDVGAFRRPRGRVLYVSPQGSDAAAGGSERLAFKTLAHAARQLRAGDTLYVMEGDYREPLVVAASGEAEQPIHIRAHGKRRISLPAVTVDGSNVTVEGFTVSGFDGDGVTVRGGRATLRHCALARNAGAGVRAEGARELSVLHCTLAGNGVGLALERGSSGAVVRDSLLASNRTGPVRVSEDSRQGVLASHNAYFGPGADARRAATETRSIVADPLFVDAARGDYRLRWDSPAGFLGLCARPAGALARAPREPRIADVRTAAVWPDAVTVMWATPQDDTTGRAAFRAKGSRKWRYADAAEQGTVHAAGSEGLRPETEYEFRVSATGRRGGEARSSVLTFKTPPAQAPAPAVRYLSPEGDDAADGRSPATAWRTLRRMNVALGPGDTALVAPGRYEHAIAPLRSGKPGRRITYRRAGKGDVIVDGAGVSGALVVLPSKSHVTVDGFIFADIVCTPSGGHLGAVVVRNAEAVEILNCRFGHKKTQGGYGRVIAAWSSTNLRVEGNVFWGTRYQLVTVDCAGIVVRNNTFVLPGGSSVYSCAFWDRVEGIRLINNIWYCPSYRNNPAVAFFPDDPKKALSGIVSDYNLFLPLKPDFNFLRVRAQNRKVMTIYGGVRLHREKVAHGDTLSEWQKSSGLDKHSVEADPMFVDVKAGDFRLRPGSPAIGAGQGGRDIGALGVAK